MPGRGMGGGREGPSAEPCSGFYPFTFAAIQKGSSVLVGSKESPLARRGRDDGSPRVSLAGLWENGSDRKEDVFILPKWLGHSDIEST
jgi:hypothetical protein